MAEAIVKSKTAKKEAYQHELAADGILAGKTVKQALLDAGYSEESAKRGKRSITGPIRAAMRKRGLELIKLGQQITKEEQEALVRGRLVDNVEQGKDKAVLSAKALGSERRVDMFRPESQVGIIVVQPSQRSEGLMLEAEESNGEGTDSGR